MDAAPGPPPPRGRWRRRRRPRRTERRRRRAWSMEAPSMETPIGPARAMAALGASTNPAPRPGAGRSLGGERPSPNACPPRRRGCGRRARTPRRRPPGFRSHCFSRARWRGEHLYTRTDVRRAARPAGWAAFRRSASVSHPHVRRFCSRRLARNDVPRRDERPTRWTSSSCTRRSCPRQLARAAVHRLGVFKTALGEVRARPEAASSCAWSRKGSSTRGARPWRCSRRACCSWWTRARCSARTASPSGWPSCSARRRRRRPPPPPPRGEFHYGASGVREPNWPWAIKVHQGIFHTLMVQKLKAQRAPALPTPEETRARAGGVAHRERAEGAARAAAAG